MSLGLKRDTCLSIVGLSKNQFYYKQTGKKAGRKASHFTVWRDPSSLLLYSIDNKDVVQKIVDIKLDPDLPNWYRMITMSLKIMGYFINHKKVYRLMFEYLLLDKPRTRSGRNFVKFRRVAPIKPLQVLEMDIKYVWIYEVRKYAYVLTVIDTFTRYVLHWAVGFTMQSHQVKEVWEYIIANYLQREGLPQGRVEIEIRNDNGKQFNSKLIIDFFKKNHLNQVFTHPYTPEENGHVESFHNTLGKALKRDHFTSLSMLENRLKRFYTCYNNERSHSSLKGVAPAKFWSLIVLNKIEVIPLEKRQIKFKLNIPYQDILTLPDINRYDYQSF